MDQAPESQEADPELLRALAAQYVDHHSDVENHVLTFSIEFRLLERFSH